MIWQRSIFRRVLRLTHSFRSAPTSAGSVLFPLFKAIFSGSDDPAEMAWRTVSVVPAVVTFATGLTVYFISDDAPTGNYADLKKHGAMPEISAAASFRSGALNINTWILFIQYATCFGVELTMNNAAALYFKDEFGQSTESAAAIASIFGWMNLVARGFGGFISDKSSQKMGMKGRLWVQTILLFFEGLLVILFANTGSLGVAILVMVFFSIFVQAAEGATYGIVSNSERVSNVWPCPVISLVASFSAMAPIYSRFSCTLCNDRFLTLTHPVLDLSRALSAPEEIQVRCRLFVTNKSLAVAVNLVSSDASFRRFCPF